MDGSELVNPYQHDARRGLSARFARSGALRRRVMRVVVLVVTVGLVTGTVATSCVAQQSPPQAPRVSSE